MSHDAKWLAGFIDGEGSFVLSIRSHGGVAPYFGLTAGNEDNIRGAKEDLSAILGREVRYRLHGGPSHKDRRPFWYIHIQALDDLKKLCDAILPFARGKRPNIEVMLQYIAIAPGGGHRGLAYRGVQAERLALVAKMRELNRVFSRGQWQALKQETELTAPPG